MMDQIKSRRQFLTAGAAWAGGAVAALHAGQRSPATFPLLQAGSTGVSKLPSMKITRLDTTYWKHPEDAPWLPNWTWVQIRTESGHVGIGETYPRNEAEAAL